MLTGLLLGLSFPPLPLPYLAWFGLVPLIVRWTRAYDPYRFITETYLAFLLMHLVAMHWVAFHTMGSVALLSVIALLVLPIPPALAIGLSLWVRTKLGSVMGLVALVLMFVGYEYVMARGAAAFVWLLLGNSQAEALMWNQIAEWTGVTGLTLWLWLMNVFFFMILLAQRLWMRIGWIAGLVLLAALPVWLSANRLARLPVASEQVRLGVVQPAMSPRAWADVKDTSRLDSLLAQSDDLLSRTLLKPSLLVWPETAMPLRETVPEQVAMNNRARSWASRNDTYLLTGAIVPREWKFDVNRPLPDRTNGPSNPYAYYNSALLVSPSSTILPAHKRKLVPFAEFVPFSNKLTALTALGVAAGGVNGYNIGSLPRSYEIQRVSGHRIGTLICFESVFGNRVRQEVAQGAKLLVVLAQNGWWHHPSGREQHLAFSRLRAIETRRAMVWATVSGPSGLLLPDGSFLHDTPFGQKASPTFAAPLHDGRTFFSRYGDWLGAIAAIASVLVVLLAFGFGFLQSR